MRYKNESIKQISGSERTFYTWNKMTMERMTGYHQCKGEFTYCVLSDHAYSRLLWGAMFKHSAV